MFTVWVGGTPIPQGSKSVTRTGMMYEANRKTGPWRKTVEAEARRVRVLLELEPYTGPVGVTLAFYMPRPQGHWRTGASTGHLLTSSAPPRPAVKPDIDKLTRAILDSLTAAGVWADDSRVVDLRVTKWYADEANPPGVRISVAPLAP